MPCKLLQNMLLEVKYKSAKKHGLVVNMSSARQKHCSLSVVMARQQLQRLADVTDEFALHCVVCIRQCPWSSWVGPARKRSAFNRGKSKNL